MHGNFCRIVVSTSSFLGSGLCTPALLLQELLTMLSFADRASVPKHVLVRFLDKESVLLNLETERYFGLDETGTRMWQLVTSAPAIDAAYQQLLDEFDVEWDILRLLL